MGQGEERNISVHITTGTIVKTLFVLLFGYLLFHLRELLLIVLTSVVLAAAIEPAAKWFRRYKVPRVPAVLIVYLVFIGLLVGTVSLFIPPLLGEINAFLGSLPAYLDTLSVWNPLQEGTQAFANSSNPIATSITDAFSLQDTIAGIQNFSNIFQSGFSGIVGPVLAIFGGVFSFVLIVVLSFYLAVQENGINNFLRLVTPVKYRSYVITLWQRTQEKIGQWAQGQLLLVVLIGVLVYLGLTILGVPYALLLGLLAGIMELIPIFGPVLSAIPAVVLAFVQGTAFFDTSGLSSAIAVTLFYVLIQQFENHLIYPLVVRKVVGVPPIVVILSLIIGWEVAGFLGILLAVPVAAGVIEFTKDLQNREEAA